MRLAKCIFNLLQEKRELNDGNGSGDVFVKEFNNETDNEEDVEEQFLPMNDTANNTTYKMLLTTTPLTITLPTTTLPTIIMIH